MQKTENYKQSEVGLIPEEWEVKELGDLLKFGSGKDYKELRTGEVPVFGTGGVMTYVNDFLYDGDSVGIGRKGTIDKPVFLSGKFWTVDTLFFTYDFKDILPKFAFYKFLLVKWKEYNEASGVPSLNKNTLEKIKISVPPLPEQTAISSALSDMDALIAQTEKLIEKKKAIKQGVMQELLTGKKRLKGFENSKGYKQTEVGLIPEDWEVLSLNEIILSTQLGGNYQNSEFENSYPLMKMGNLDRGRIKLDKVQYIQNAKPKAIDRLNYGDLLFNTRNTLELVGKIAVWRGELNEAYFNSNLMRIKFNDNIGSTFWANLIFNTPFFIEQLKSIAIGTTSVAAIYTRDLFKLLVPLPTPAEQIAIALSISDIEKEIELYKKKLNKLKIQKQGMMQALLTGKIRLV